MDRLMALRDALVALKGPLANDSALQENLHRQLFNDEANSRVLGRISTPLPQPTHRITYGEDH
ncbi:type VI secretion system contractile sheath small subunit [Pseudomonas sp. ChxA]|nr:type VI secretion system contractile sheath small subunit [Pseudomonas sp. ChxA]MDL2185657.1 type VI secretion system contractile sheath small subunit [Pseudomonas sp. ChxA]